MILALDPSSTCIGYAIFGDGEALREHGLIKPRRTKDKAYNRMVHMTDDVMDLVRSLTFQAAKGTGEALRGVVIETTSGKVNRGRHGGGGAGLAVYGMAVGFVLGRLSGMIEAESIYPVEENVWTRGTPKAKRQAQVGFIHKSYDASTDPGGDAADAIGLGQWWITEQKIHPSPIAGPQMHDALHGAHAQGRRGVLNS